MFSLGPRVGNLLDQLQPDSADWLSIFFGNPASPEAMFFQVRLHPVCTAREKF
jgi:hypothetical protein